MPFLAVLTAAGPVKLTLRGAMSSQVQKQQSRLKELIAKGKEQGYITYAEVNDHLPDEISDPDQIEDIIRMINDMGITVYETAPDADELLTSEENTADEVAAEEAAAALAAVETEAGRTTDPVRMYMREMGTVELLTLILPGNFNSAGIISFFDVQSHFAPTTRAQSYQSFTAFG